MNSTPLVLLFFLQIWRKMDDWSFPGYMTGLVTDVLALYLVIFSRPPSILPITGTVFFLEMVTINHLFHSPWCALMWSLRLSA